MLRAVFAVACDDAVADGFDRGFGLALDGPDRGPADEAVAFFADVTAVHGLVRLAVPRGEPRPAAPRAVGKRAGHRSRGWEGVLSASGDFASDASTGADSVATVLGRALTSRRFDSFGTP
jgi:hypothetical protein